MALLRPGRGLLIILIASLIVSGFAMLQVFMSIPFVNPILRNVPVPASSPFDHVVTVLMENNGYCDVMTTCGGGGAYETSLAQNNTITGTCSTDSSCSVGGYTAIAHPSLPNYIALLGGDTHGVVADGVCCYTLAGVNLIDRVETAGLSWSAWAEDATGSGTCSFTPPRNGDHFPFKVFSDMNTTSRCNHFFTTASPASPTGTGDNEFVSSLTSTASNFVWLTPTDCDNGHDSCGIPCGPSNSGGGCVGGGDAYLSRLVPRILSSPLFRDPANKAALFIVYDEGGSSAPHDFVYGTWAGTPVKPNYAGVGSYSHYSWSKTIETYWGLACMSNDCNANPMTDFFRPVITCTPLSAAGFSISPASPVTGQVANFAATSLGGYGPYSYLWSFGDESFATDQQTSHAYSMAVTYSVSLTITDSCPNGHQSAFCMGPVTVVSASGSGGSSGGGRHAIEQ